MTIEFKNPPARTGRGLASETHETLGALQARPGDWALIKTDVTPAAAVTWKKHEGLEVRTTSIGKPKGKCDIYARWVGTP